MQILIELVIIYDCSVIGCTRHELLDKERTFPCACAVSEAMRRNWTRRLRTDFSFHPRKQFRINHTHVGVKQQRLRDVHSFLFYTWICSPLLFFSLLLLFLICSIWEKITCTGADLDRFIRFAQTCQIFSQKNFLECFCKVQTIPDFMGSEFALQ